MCHFSQYIIFDMQLFASEKHVDVSWKQLHELDAITQWLVCCSASFAERGLITWIRFPSSHVIGPSAACGTKSLSLTFPNSISVSVRATRTTNHNLTYTHNQGWEPQQSARLSEWCWRALGQGVMAAQWLTEEDPGGGRMWWEKSCPLQ